MFSILSQEYGYNQDYYITTLTTSEINLQPTITFLDKNDSLLLKIKLNEQRGERFGPDCPHELETIF